MSGTFGCYKNTIRLRSGLYLDLTDPKPDQFTLADIAGGLSKLCRYGGQVEHFYSVAEHSVNCMLQAHQDEQPIEVQRLALMHDAAEAFIGDVIKPLKVMLSPLYDVIEDRIEKVIFTKFNLSTDPAHWSAAKEIDRAILIAERRVLFSRDNKTWTGENEVRRVPLEIRCLQPASAEGLFLWNAKVLGLS